MKTFSYFLSLQDIKFYLSVYKGRRAKTLVLYLITDYNLINAGMKSANVAEKIRFPLIRG